jgi:hypothetical protein
LIAELLTQARLAADEADVASVEGRVEKQVHFEAVFIIVAFSSLAIAAAVIIALLRRHARADPEPDAASITHEYSKADDDS